MRFQIMWLMIWSKEMGKKYGVNPWFFAILYFGTIPPYGYCIYRFIACIKYQGYEFLFWLAMILTTFSLPYLYVLIWGRNLSKRFYLFLGLWMTVAVITAICKIVHRL